MDLLFSVDNQTVTRTDELAPASGTINYLFAKFTFTADWDVFTVKQVSFRPPNAAPIIVTLDANNRCAVPTEVITPGHFAISVFAEDATPRRVTTDETAVWIKLSGFIDL